MGPQPTLTQPGVGAAHMVDLLRSVGLLLSLCCPTCCPTVPLLGGLGPPAAPGVLFAFCWSFPGSRSLPLTPSLPRSRPALVGGSQLGREWAGRRIAKPLLQGFQGEGGGGEPPTHQQSRWILKSSPRLSSARPATLSSCDANFSPHNARLLLWPRWMWLD